MNFVLQIMPGKMDINLNHMSSQATVAFLSTSAMLHEMMMMTKFLHFSCMTGTLVPCIRCLHSEAASTSGQFAVQQLERGCGIPEGTIGCQHPLYSWALLHAAWLHNRYVVKQGHTAYELCADRTYSGRVAMFGECVLGYLRQSAKGAPQWTKGIWLGKTINNDVNIVAVPGNNQLFVTRSQDVSKCVEW